MALHKEDDDVIRMPNKLSVNPVRESNVLLTTGMLAEMKEWVAGVEFGSMDYSSSEEIDMDRSKRFDEMTVAVENFSGRENYVIVFDEMNIGSMTVNDFMGFDG